MTTVNPGHPSGQGERLIQTQAGPMLIIDIIVALNAGVPIDQLRPKP